MLEFIQSIVTYPIPLWSVVVLGMILMVVGYFILKESLQMFAPVLVKTVNAIVKENTDTATQQLHEVSKEVKVLQAQIPELNKNVSKHLDIMILTYEKELKSGSKTLVSICDKTEKHYWAFEVLSTKLMERVEAIKVLESEIIKLKHIIKRK